MENSTKPEDREKAKVLRKAIEKASEGGVETRFTTLIEMLRGGNTSNNTEQLQDILNENKELRQLLREIVELLLKDDRDAELKRQIAEARRLLEELKAVIRKQELVLNKTIIGRTKSTDLAKSQHNVKEQTHDLTNPKSDRGKEAKQGEGKGVKSGKQGVGEGKNDSKDPKADSKESKSGKSSESKDGKQGEGKEGKGNKSSESKDGKPSAGKENKPEPAKPANSKPNDGKPGDGKGKGQGKGEAKSGSGQSSKGKQGESKPGQSGQSGQQGQQGQSEGKSDNKKGGQQQQQQQQPNQEQSQIKKQIQDAEKYQDRAEDDLRKDNRKDAPDNEQAALDKLNQAKKALEDLLRQLREEEIERLLARLEQRCRTMLKMQIGVRDDTVALDKVIKANADAQATRADQQASLVLSDREEEIVKEARAGLRLLEEEGSAVAFAEVFAQVKGDMELVAARLRKTDTGVVTVTIEDQIIDTLKEMIEALKKAQSNKKGQSSSGSGTPAPQPLLDLLAELKMIRSMQKRINARTDLYGKQYAGEQAPPPEQGSTPDERERYERIQGELKDLSKRQQKTAKVTHDIASGKNDHK